MDCKIHWIVPNHQLSERQKKNVARRLIMCLASICPYKTFTSLLSEDHQNRLIKAFYPAHSRMPQPCSLLLPLPPHCQSGWTTSQPMPLMESPQPVQHLPNQSSPRTLPQLQHQQHQGASRQASSPPSSSLHRGGTAGTEGGGTKEDEDLHRGGASGAEGDEDTEGTAPPADPEAGALPCFTPKPPHSPPGNVASSSSSDADAPSGACVCVCVSWLCVCPAYVSSPINLAVPSSGYSETSTGEDSSWLLNWGLAATYMLQPFLAFFLVVMCAHVSILFALAQAVLVKQFIMTARMSWDPLLMCSPVPYMSLVKSCCDVPLSLQVSRPRPVCQRAPERLLQYRGILKTQCRHSGEALTE
eukprot:1159468-Pelagomonas_calceolata.AAC.1